MRTTPRFNLLATWWKLADRRRGGGGRAASLECLRSPVVGWDLEPCGIWWSTTLQEWNVFSGNSLESQSWSDTSMVHWWIPASMKIRTLRGGTGRIDVSERRRISELRHAYLWGNDNNRRRPVVLGQCLRSPTRFEILMICGTWKKIRLHIWWARQIRERQK